MKLLPLLKEWSFIGWELIIDDESKNLIKQKVPIPDGYRYVAHHMTIGILDKDLEGEPMTVKAIALGSMNGVIALKVESPIKTYTKNFDNDYMDSTSHITVAINNEGKAKMSNDIVNWQPIDPFLISGIIS